MIYNASAVAYFPGVMRLLFLDIDFARLGVTRLENGGRIGSDADVQEGVIVSETRHVEKSG